MIQVLIFMACTFVLGTALGWLVSSFGRVKMKKAAEAEVEFWRKYSEQNKSGLDRLREENEVLKQKTGRAR
ncbi:hypothetical protein [Yoonia sp. 2307UL14-13]|uniref:hypothetical protein n=1 Tax=Yoonia sp. 2307UL14-13 TaxID=3126506 RepID=UPI0030B4F9E9